MVSIKQPPGHINFPHILQVVIHSRNRFVWQGLPLREEKSISRDRRVFCPFMIKRPEKKKSEGTFEKVPPSIFTGIQSARILCGGAFGAAKRCNRHWKHRPENAL